VTDNVWRTQLLEIKQFQWTTLRQFVTLLCSTLFSEKMGLLLALAHIICLYNPYRTMVNVVIGLSTDYCVKFYPRKSRFSGQVQQEFDYTLSLLFLRQCHNGCNILDIMNIIDSLIQFCALISLSPLNVAIHSHFLLSILKSFNRLWNNLRENYSNKYWFKSFWVQAECFLISLRW